MRWKTARKRERRNHWKRKGHQHIALKNTHPLYSRMIGEAHEYQPFTFARGYTRYPNH